MAKPRFTEADTRRAIFEADILKQLCQVEQDGHRAMIVSLKNLEKRLGLRQTKCYSLKRIRVDNIDRIYKSIQEELEWRKDQIEIIEIERRAAHKMIKYHSKRMEEFLGVVG